MIKVVNGIHESFIFNCGECNVRLSEIVGDRILIQALLNNSDEIMKLLLVVDSLRRINYDYEIYLTIPYFPYARQDRVCNEGEALGVKVMADLINNLKCKELTIYDPHSDVTPALLNNVRVIPIENIFSPVYFDEFCAMKNRIVLVSPDAGAEKKTERIAKKLGLKKIIKASKVRNTKTGDIKETKLLIDFELEISDVYIVIDDICDAGRTFIELAKVLKTYGIYDINLFVTHGIFSNGLDELFEYYKKIYCNHLVKNIDIPKRHADRFKITGQFNE